MVCILQKNGYQPTPIKLTPIKSDSNYDGISRYLLIGHANMYYSNLTYCRMHVFRKHHLYVLFLWVLFTSSRGTDSLLVKATCYVQFNYAHTYIIKNVDLKQ